MRREVMSRDKTRPKLLVNQVTIGFDMLGSLIKNRVRSNVQSRLVVTEKRNMSDIGNMQFMKKRNEPCELTTDHEDDEDLTKTCEDNGDQHENCIEIGVFIAELNNTNSNTML
ncbi:hypothetical protein AgCh_039874 [Apium graveolens]